MWYVCGSTVYKDAHKRRQTLQMACIQRLNHVIFGISHGCLQSIDYSLSSCYSFQIHGSVQAQWLISSSTYTDYGFASHYLCHLQQTPPWSSYLTIISTEKQTLFHYFSATLPLHSRKSKVSKVIASSLFVYQNHLRLGPTCTRAVRLQNSKSAMLLHSVSLIDMWFIVRDESRLQYPGQRAIPG